MALPSALNKLGSAGTADVGMLPSRYYRDPNYSYTGIGGLYQQVADRYARGDFTSPWTIDTRGINPADWGKVSGYGQLTPGYYDDPLGYMLKHGGSYDNAQQMYSGGQSRLTEDQYKYLQYMLKSAPAGSFIDPLGRMIVPGSKIITDQGTYVYKGGSSDYTGPQPGSAGWMQQYGGATPTSDWDPTRDVLALGQQAEDRRMNFGNWVKEGETTPQNAGNMSATVSKSMLESQNPFYASGMAYNKEWKGTIGPGGWNAIRGIMPAVTGAAGALWNAAGSGMTAGEQAAVGLSQASGMAPQTAMNIVNAIQRIGLPALMGYAMSGGNPYGALTGAAGGAAGWGVGSLTGNPFAGSMASFGTTQGMNYLNQPTQRNALPAPAPRNTLSTRYYAGR